MWGNPPIWGNSPVDPILDGIHGIATIGVPSRQSSCIMCMHGHWSYQVVDQTDDILIRLVFSSQNVD
jgi:hypothetical protein